MSVHTNMKIFVTFLFIISSVYASAIHEYEAPATVVSEAKVATGVSSQSRAQDNQGNYAFAYKEDHPEGGTFRKESGNALGQVIGSYGLRVADGRVRIVNYVADDVHGFRAKIATNEPGTAAQASAATSISSPHVAISAPAPAIDNHAPAVAIVENVHNAPTHLHSAPAVQVAEQLVRPHYAQPSVAYDNHSPEVALEHHDYAPSSVALAAPYSPAALVEAPAQLIRTYATSIYGPSILTDNAFSRAIPREVASYVPPLNSPAAYGVPTALQAHDGSGFYEPTLVYSNPSSIGYSLGTNVGQFGYQLTYRKKKK